MRALESAKPVTASIVSGLRGIDRLGWQINFKANKHKRHLQVRAHSKLRLQRLAAQIYTLGPYPLFHLLAEIVNGAPAFPAIERYARLNREHGEFIRALGGDQFPGRLFVIDGNYNK